MNEGTGVNEVRKLFGLCSTVRKILAVLQRLVGVITPVVKLERYLALCDRSGA